MDMIPQARIGVVQRLGAFHRASESGLIVVLPTSSASATRNHCMRGCAPRRYRPPISEIASTFLAPGLLRTTPKRCTGQARCSVTASCRVLQTTPAGSDAG